jgi:hypothetical protein
MGVRTLARLVPFILIASAMAACSRGSSHSTATPPTATPPATAAASATVRPTSPYFESVDPIFTHRPYADHETIDARAGVAFVDAASGASDTWELKDPGEYQRIGAAPDGESITTYVLGQTNKSITLRPGGETYQLAQGVVPVSMTGTVLAAWVPDGDDVVFALTDFESGTTSPTPVHAPKRGEYGAIPSPDGSRFVAIADGTLWLVDGADGTAVHAPVEAPAEAWIAPLWSGRGVAVTVRQETSMVIDFDGKKLAEAAGASLSPDGALVATTQPVTQFALTGMGEYPALSAVNIVRVPDGVLVSRVDGASFAGWLAGGAGVFVMEQHAAFRAFSLDGRDLGQVPSPGLFQGPPQPSPTDANVVLTTEGLRTLSSGALHGPTFASYRQVLLQWSVDGATAMLAFQDMPGKDGGVAAQLFPPVFESPPVADLSGVRVEGGSDCVNLRGSPSIDGEVRGCFASGTTATITDTYNPLVNSMPLQVGGAVEPVTWKAWLHVSIGTNGSGWMRADNLAWPALP